MDPAAPPQPPAHPPLPVVAGISGAALALEILLLRLLAIVHWHHFAYFVITIALLGYGASGTLVTLGRDRLVRHWRGTLAGSAVAFVAAAPLSFLLAQRVPFNALEVAWGPGPWLHLGTIALLLALPFLCAATGLAVCLAAFPGRAAQVYAADLLGAGLGAVGVLALLQVRTPLEALQAVTGLAGLAAAGALHRLPRGRPAAWGAAAAALLLAALPWPVALRMTPFKPLAMALRVPESRVLWEASHPMGLVSVVASPAVPFHFAPGLSLQHSAGLPEQLGVFQDGAGFEALNRYGGDRSALAFLGASPSAAAYLLAEPGAAVALLGAGTGTAALQALLFDTGPITAVERHPAYRTMVQERFREFAGWDRLAARVCWVVDDPRRHLQANPVRYGVIQIPLAGGEGGAAALESDYTLTREALAEYWAGLSPGGLLAVSRWADLPPRDALRLAGMVIELLEGEGLRAADHLAMLRDWSSVTLIAARRALGGADVARLRDFCRRQGFDGVHWPGIREDEVNRFHRQAAPLLHRGVTALLGPDSEAFRARYKFDLRPVSDDRPFFGQFLRWRTLPEIAALIPQGGAGLMEWGVPVLLITLGLSLVLGLVLIVLPLWAARPLPAGGGLPLAVTVYFAALGMGFLFLEIAAIHQLTRLLHSPVYAASVAVATFLLGAGAGSAWIRRVQTAPAGRPPQLAPIAGLIAAVGLGLPAAVDAAAGAVPPGFWSWGLAVAGLVPLTFLLGLPFPLGLGALARIAPRSIPWAWCINGCAAVLAGPLATLLAMQWGFTRLRWAAILCYALAAWAFGRLRPAR